ncbi:MULTISPECIES: thioredoxin [unclassified Porphyromonas]|uniref:thioredoxin n=1 Tax=unclassified Porphyromonas TaxID=2645799 RepID=UPI00052C8EE9|nr:MULTISPECIES: thioredoxin [unclassified Porphyromonas]KGN86511.1 thioredoxin [Porphyromonas sp. COT-290 OH860]KGO00783.1 thioredoxin [Porphyromonas sp. COT-290 OH3588]
MALQITDQNFEALVAEGKPLVVDFWATWCGPCQMVGPIIDELSSEYAGKANIGKCDVDANSDLPGRFGVRNIPTVLFFKNGELVDKLVGAQSKDAYKQKIDGLL